MPNQSPTIGWLSIPDLRGAPALGKDISKFIDAVLAYGRELYAENVYIGRTWEPDEIDGDLPADVYVPADLVLHALAARRYFDQGDAAGTAYKVGMIVDLLRGSTAKQASAKQRRRRRGQVEEQAFLLDERNHRICKRARELKKVRGLADHQLSGVIAEEFSYGDGFPVSVKQYREILRKGHVIN